MAINAFGRRKGDNGMGQATATTASPTPSPSGSSSGGLGNLTAFIDQGSEFEGKLSFKDTVRIDGTFAGEISSDNTLIVGETGEIHRGRQWRHRGALARHRGRRATQRRHSHEHEIRIRRFGERLARRAQGTQAGPRRRLVEIGIQTR
jgi:hypothetical protein